MEHPLIKPARLDDPTAAELVAAAVADLSQRYGGPGDATPMSPAQFAPPGGGFVIAWLGSEPAGCGGWRSREDFTATAEIKRMYTVPRHRGRGVASAVLRAVEESARTAGMRRVILETGDRQPEAIALYERHGYEKIPNFGYYRDEPGCVSYGRDL